MFCESSAATGGRGERRYVVALADANNFYANCEAVFRPDLKGLPVVVLSNNDGCVVARSAAAKALGIPMGAPFFRLEKEFIAKGVIVFSSNYELYGDFSRRINRVYGRFTPDFEVYSIDETFLAFHARTPDLTGLGGQIRERVAGWTGIPICIGFGWTKTQAKAANRLAKTRKEFGGVLDLTRRDDVDDLLESLAVGDVWGIGRRYASLLKRHGIETARGLRDARDDWVRANLSVVGLRIVLELRGTPCLPFELATKPKQTLISSRSFGRPVGVLDDLRRAVAFHAARAAERLRKQNSTATAIQLFTRSRACNGAPATYDAATFDLRLPTSYTPDFTRTALELLDRLFRKGHAYKGVGVMLLGIGPEVPTQQNLYVPLPTEKQRAAMEAVDAVNRRFGRGTIRTAREIGNGLWEMKSERRSPRWTTRWDELPTVK